DILHLYPGGQRRFPEGDLLLRRNLGGDADIGAAASFPEPVQAARAHRGAYEALGRRDVPHLGGTDRDLAHVHVVGEREKVAVVDAAALGLEDDARGLLPPSLPIQLAVTEDLDRNEAGQNRAVKEEPQNRQELETPEMERAHRVTPASTGAAGNPTTRSVKEAGSARRTDPRSLAAKPTRARWRPRGSTISTSTTRAGSGFWKPSWPRLTGSIPVRNAACSSRSCVIRIRFTSVRTSRASRSRSIESEFETVRSQTFKKRRAAASRRNAIMRGLTRRLGWARNDRRYGPWSSRPSSGASSAYPGSTRE